MWARVSIRAIWGRHAQPITVELPTTRWCPCQFRAANVVSMEVVVSVDQQGRLVLPRRLRAGLVDVPGRVVVRRTAEGLLLTPDRDAGAVRRSDDGLPVLDLGRPVSNDEVLAAIDEDRAAR